VVARKTFRCRAWDLGAALDWAAGRAAGHGFAGLTVACEPTGHRWRVLDQLAADAPTVVTGGPASDLVAALRRAGVQEVSASRLYRGAHSSDASLHRVVAVALVWP